MALRNDMARFMKGGYAVGAVPGTVLTSDTGFIIMIDNAVFKFNIAVGRTAYEAGGVDTVVTGHGVKKGADMTKLTRLHLSDTAPLNIGGIVVLFITGHFTASTADTFACIKMKTVLFALLKLGQIYGVVTALHARLGLVIDKAL